VRRGVICTLSAAGKVLKLVRCLRCLLLLLICGLGLRPQAVRAQTIHWNERRTLQFSLLYPDDASAAAEQYAHFVDGIYEEISAWWGYRATTPIVLRIYPTKALYEQVNPQAALIPGVIAHAHTGRREISIDLEQTTNQSQEEIMNNVRHELTHIVAADLSGNKLSAMWQEGIAQNAEHRTAQLDTKMHLMDQAMQTNQVLDWNALNQPSVVYDDPQLAYPESYTIVGFLLRRDGMDAFRSFVQAMRWTSNYRDALRGAYKISANQLEREWLDQLAAFVGGDYHNAPAPALDLSGASSAINRGDYSGAIESLKPKGAGGATSNTDVATALLQRARDGQTAVDSANAARSELANSDYDSAARSAATAVTLFQELGQNDQAQVAEQYATFAQRGLDAEAQIETAQSQLRRLRIGAAQATLTTAWITFTQLGDAGHADQAQAALRAIERGEQALVIGMLLLACGMLLWNGWQRRAQRPAVLPFS
jgi:hypothetical protein